MDHYTADIGSPRTNVFHNDSTIANQAGIQNISGSVNHYTTNNYGNSRPPGPEPNLHTIQSRRLQFRESLRFSQIEARYTTIKSAHLKTCQWLLTRSEYSDWQQDDKLPEHHGLIWIKGKPATGKSTIMKFVFTNTQEQEVETTALSFFFNARGEELEKSTNGMYRSLLFQLISMYQELLSVFDTFRVGLESMSSSDWDNAALVYVFSNVVKRLHGRRVVCFIDALDECNEEQVRDMISVFEDLGRTANDSGTTFRICFSSRHYPHITVSYGITLILEEQDEHEQDLKEYLQTELRIGSSKTALQVRRELLQRASGIFLWVVLATRILNKEYDRGQMSALRKRLDVIPDDLGALFYDLLSREGLPGPQLILCIQWVLYARAPLTPEELYFAIISGTEPELLASWDPEEVSQQDIQRYILNCSRGLVEQTKSQRPTIQFIHESVRDYFFTEQGLSSFYAGPMKSFVADSHDKLKQCCDIHYRKAFELSSDTLIYLPFLTYSVLNLFYHCDLAQKYGHHQDAFLKDMILKPWVRFYNTCYQHEAYPSDVSLLYVLAALDASSLVRVLCQQNLVNLNNLVCGRYPSPLKVALALENSSTLEVLLSPSNEDMPSNLECAGLVVPNQDDVSQAVSVLLQTKDVLTGRSIFTHAAHDGHLSVIRCMIQSQWHGEVCNTASALKAASERGHENVVRMLVAIGADVNAQTGYFGNILQTASMNGHDKVVHVLIDAGADVNAHGSYFGSALQAASTRGHEAVVKTLLNAGAKVNTQAGYFGNALQAASTAGRDDLVQILIDAGADVNQQGGYYANALQAAIEHGHEKVKQILIDNGAEFSVEEADGAFYLPDTQPNHGPRE